ncbi:Leucine-rich repeat 2, partial [Arabidopsis thaliana x Arabidopsis arenosa]
GIHHSSKLEPLPQYGYLSRLSVFLHAPDLNLLITFLESCPNLKSLVLSQVGWDRELSDEEMNRIGSSFVPKCLLSSLELYGVLMDDAVFGVLPCLKTMHLEENCYTSEATFEKLVSSCCPVLENLKIAASDIDGIVYRVRSPSLKRLSIERKYIVLERYCVPGVLIDAPLLCCLTIDDHDSYSFIVKNLQSNAELNISYLDFGLGKLGVESRLSNIRDFLLGISRVGNMKICLVPFKVICGYSEQEPLPQFDYISRLCISLDALDFKWLELFLRTCPNLKSLVLMVHDTYDFWEIYQSSFQYVPKCLVSSLEFVDFKFSIRGHDDQMKIVRFRLLRSSFRFDSDVEVVIDAPLLCSLRIKDTVSKIFIVNNLGSNAKLDIDLNFGLKDFCEESVSSRRSCIRSFLPRISKVMDMTISKETFKVDVCYYYLELRSKEIDQSSFPYVPECLLSSLEFVDFQLSRRGHSEQMKLVSWLSQNYWIAEERHCSSWIWRFMAALKPMAKGLLGCSLGDGKTASYWFDDWNSLGPLIDVLGTDGPRLMGIPLEATVSQGIDPQGWRLPSMRTRNSLLLSVRNVLCSLEPPRDSLGPDSFTWGAKGSRKNFFSTKSTWKLLRPSSEVKGWKKAVWFSRGVPKHSFTFWVANLNRLPLKTRMASWGFNDISSTLKKLVTQATVYLLWKERNLCAHGSTLSSPETLFRHIDRVIKDILLAHRYRKQGKGLLSKWFAHL